ncbi:MAG: IucA/IucC family protein [Patescibacteria group bacterium]
MCTKDYHALADYSEVSKEYVPQKIGNGFELPLFKFPINLYGDIDSIPSILKEYFPIHPDTITDLKLKKEDAIQNINVLPTSSMRTVLAKIENRDIFIKLSINRYIARSKRKLTSKQIKHGLAVTLDIKDTLSEKPSQLQDFAFLPEVAGMTIAINEEEIGTVIRETKPYPKSKANKGYIPFFALYSTDIHNSSDEPLLAQLLKQNNADPLDFTLEKIIEPVIRHFNYFASERGLLLQAHAQNTLLEIDSDFKIGRIIYRDFGGTTIDGEVRANKGLSRFENYSIDNQNTDRVDSVIEYSLRYDEFMAAHSFELLGKILEKYFKLDLRIFKERIKKIFSDTVTCKDKFPKVQYSIPVELSVGKFKPFILKEVPDYR